MWGGGYRVGKRKATIRNRLCCVLLAGKVNELCSVTKIVPKHCIVGAPLTNQNEYLFTSTERSLIVT